MKHHTFFYFFNYGFLQFFFFKHIYNGYFEVFVKFDYLVAFTGSLCFLSVFFSPMHGYAFLLLYVSYFCCWKLGILDIIL